MEHKDIREILAPCGLDCHKCFAYFEGEIRTLSVKLQELLGSFDRSAKRFSTFLSVFENYPSFKKLLAHFTKSDCKGCRKGTCIRPHCGVMACYGERGVDFCFQCNEFPCQKANFDPDFERRWIQMNNRMKKIGVEAYYEETKYLPRYR